MVAVVHCLPIGWRCAADLKEQLSVLASVEALNWRKMPKSYKIDQVQYDKCFDKFLCFDLLALVWDWGFFSGSSRCCLPGPGVRLADLWFVWLSVWFLYRFHLTTLRGASWGFLCDGRKVGAVGAAFAPAVAEKWGAEHGSMDYLWIWMLWDSMPDGKGSACKLAKYQGKFYYADMRWSVQWTEWHRIDFLQRSVQSSITIHRTFPHLSILFHIFSCIFFQIFLSTFFPWFRDLRLAEPRSRANALKALSLMGIEGPGPSQERL